MRDVVSGPDDVTVLPTRSEGVLVSPLGGVVVVYDLVSEKVHLVNPTAGLLLLALDGNTDPADLAAVWAEQTGVDQATVDRDVRDGIDLLTASGLLGRSTTQPELPPLEGSKAPPPSELGVVHAVLEHGVQFRGNQRALVDAIDDWLGMADEGRPATVGIDVDQVDDGTITLVGDAPWQFSSIEGLFSQLPTIVNEYAVDSATCVALHAGGVRRPGGGVTLLPAESGAGKSTLTAALVEAGWDYLGDEAIGIREGSLDAVAYAKPLALDATSRSVLGLDPSDSQNTDATELRADVVKLTGECGPVTQVVLPVFRADAERSLVRLESSDALLALLAHTLNLRRVGQVGLDTLCQVALTVPVYRLVHPGVVDAMEAVTTLD